MLKHGAARIASVLLSVALGLAISPARASGALEGVPSAFLLNGVRFDVVTVSFPGEPRQVAAALAARWEAAGAGRPFVHHVRGAWIVGRQRGLLHETAAFRAAGARGVVAGRVAVTDLSRSPAQPASPGFRLPPGLRVLQVFEDLSDSTGSRLLVLSSRVGVDGTWQRLQGVLGDAGLKVESRRIDGTAGAGSTRVFGAWSQRLSTHGVIRAVAGGARVVLVSRGQASETP